MLLMHSVNMDTQVVGGGERERERPLLCVAEQNPKKKPSEMQIREQHSRYTLQFFEHALLP
jgi:hypothetical protein